MGRIWISHVNLFAQDPVKLAGFYTALFGFAEIPRDRSPIFVGLDAGNTKLGFHAPAAYELLELNDRMPGDAGVHCYFTVEVEDEASVAALSAQAVVLGARVIKPPSDTYYNARQCVLADPEDNVFRINHAR